LTPWHHEGVSEPISAQVQAPLAWGDVANVPVLAANQFIVQVAVDAQNVAELILTVGHLAPPVLLGTPEQQQAAAAALTQLTVRPVARFSVPIAKAAELAKVIESQTQGTENRGQQP
jgi:hypothetical protein